MIKTLQEKNDSVSLNIYSLVDKYLATNINIDDKNKDKILSKLKNKLKNVDSSFINNIMVYSDVDVKSKKFPLLLYLIQKDDKNLIKTLVDAGLNLNTYYKDFDVNGVGYVAYSGKYELLKLFIDLGANILLKVTKEHVGDPYYWDCTLLHRVMDRDIPNKKEIIDILVQNYDDYNIKAANGKTPMDWAQSYSETTVNYLLEAIALKEKNLLEESINNSINRNINRIKI